MLRTVSAHRELIETFIGEAPDTPQPLDSAIKGPGQSSASLPGP
ncbi:hypothetical protein [Streptomyces sp. NBC_00503]|nr:hypothetical protein [Streptomyces sp. NBC_00503]WUD79253.1 hypothetical protein OG490_00940 [Streptomyces sp. NBC_00503]